jgi:hypothetical protein
VNYLLPGSLPNSELLKHQQQQCDSAKQAESSYLQSKGQATMLHKSNDIFSSYDLPVLTPLKYVESGVEYNSGTDEQIRQYLTSDVICDDVVSEDVGDCVQDFTKEIPIKNVKRSLPHKKRIARKHNPDQFSIIIAAAGDDSAMRSVNVSQDVSIWPKYV